MMLARSPPMGLDPVPSVASLARIFRKAGVARAKAEKEAAFGVAAVRLSRTERVLTAGRDRVRAERWPQVRDLTAHRRLFPVRGRFPCGVGRDGAGGDRGVRQGRCCPWWGQFVEHVSRLGVEAITGKPDKPTTHGKNERFHQTLFRYLDKQPLADTLAGLQAQVDAFDHIYNTQRPHQGLPGRVTPQVAWEATAKAQPPRPHARPAPARAGHCQTASPRACRGPGEEVDRCGHVHAGGCPLQG
jgi:transposase InsO family protein